MADGFAAKIDAHPKYELVAPVSLSLVAFRHVDGDAATERIRDAINSDGDAYLTHTKLAGTTALRVSIGAVRTEQRHVDAIYDLLDSLA